MVSRVITRGHISRIQDNADEQLRWRCPCIFGCFGMVVDDPFYMAYMRDPSMLTRHGVSLLSHGKG